MLNKFASRHRATRSFAATMFALTAVVGFFAFTSFAQAIVTPTVTVQLSDNQLGAHADTTVKLDFNYGNSHPVLYPPTSPFFESVKNTVVDIPAGLVGNPNAVPVEDRCDPSVFETSICPASATVGTFSVSSTLLGTVQDYIDFPPNASTDFIEMTITEPNTRLSLLRTDPEVPAVFGIWIKLPFGLGIVRQKIQIAPDVNSDLKLRTTAIPAIVRSFDTGTGAPGDPVITNFIRIDSLTIKFLGTLANGNKFMTNPTSCTKWESRVWVNAYENNSNSTENPLGTGELYNSATAPAITPDCTNQTTLPFPITGTTTVSSNARDISPDFDFTINVPGAQANDDAVSTTPKKIVTTVPASINVDINQLGRLCENDQFAADSCPDSTKVGTVAIETPLIRAGLTGDVYLVRAVGRALPDLGMHIRGAIHFTQRGQNSYVGTKGNQIQTVFDDIPQVGFTRLNVHLFGGPQGLLRSLKCPVGNRRPADGSFTYDFYSYAGQVVNSSTVFRQTNCFGIQKLRRFNCVYRLLRFQPTYTSRARVRRVSLSIDGRRVATATHQPFQFRVPVRKFKRGKHRMMLRALYDDGTVSKKRSSFKRC